MDRLGFARVVRLLDGLEAGREDLFLGSAFEQGDEFLGVERLPDQEDLGDALEVRLAGVEDVLRGLVGVLDDTADLVIDLAGDLVGVVGLGPCLLYTSPSPRDS